MSFVKAAASLLEAFETIAPRFRSGNVVPVDKAVIPALEWKQLQDSFTELMASLKLSPEDLKKYLSLENNTKVDQSGQELPNAGKPVESDLSIEQSSKIES